MTNEMESAKLRHAFMHFDHDGDGVITADDLARSVDEAVSRHLSTDDLARLLQRASPAGGPGLSLEGFMDHMRDSARSLHDRARALFARLDQDGDGHLARGDLALGMADFGLTRADTDFVFAEMDLDGDERIDFDEFVRPIVRHASETGEADEADEADEAAAPEATGVATTVHERVFEANASGGEAAVEQVSPPPPAAEARLQPRPAAPGQAPPAPADTPQGTTVLQMQAGLFRLLQGAAYRCFRVSVAAHHETHRQVKTLPYRITDFVAFVDSAVALYKALGVVEVACHPVLDSLAAEVKAEFARLQQRIAQWPTLEKTPAMQAEAQAMDSTEDRRSRIFGAFLTAVDHFERDGEGELALADLVKDYLLHFELTILQGLAAGDEMALLTPPAQGEPQAYLQQWQRVILESLHEQVPGAMMPVAWWYETFMPRLLAACSVARADDVEPNTQPDEAALDAWFAQARAAGEFDRHGELLRERFPGASPRMKLALRQAWRLTRDYLLGVNKRRERLEAGRDDGEITHYVAFIDAPLGASSVRDAQMRVSFPYYLGPAVWRFLHTAAELVAAQPAAAQRDSVAAFKTFFRLFAALYPCPYCRHHLNAYVVRNRELGMYPLEYLLLGQRGSDTDFSMSLEHKLATITDGASLRLFLWKLHNTVSSSIERTEEWYRQDPEALYTTRFWPSLDNALARAHALGQELLPAADLSALHALTRPLSRLATDRADLHSLVLRREWARVQEMIERAQPRIRELENAVLQGGFLQACYRLQRDAESPSPAFGAAEEAYARSGRYVQT